VARIIVEIDVSQYENIDKCNESILEVLKALSPYVKIVDLPDWLTKDASGEVPNREEINTYEMYGGNFDDTYDGGFSDGVTEEAQAIVNWFKDGWWEKV
jgi:hypothetical protein